MQKTGDEVIKCKERKVGKRLDLQSTENTEGTWWTKVTGWFLEMHLNENLTRSSSYSNTATSHGFAGRFEMNVNVVAMELFVFMQKPVAFG